MACFRATAESFRGDEALRFFGQRKTLHRKVASNAVES
jgi:hypothetical protein